MTEQTVKEATKYVEKSIESQTRLGYRRPAKAAVKAAIDETAVALAALERLAATGSTRRR